MLFGYQHFAFLGPESQWSAEASECAGDQDKFWEYHDLLFASQAGENQGAFAKDKLKLLASNLGLDSAAFNECMDTDKYAGFVQTQSANARTLGVRSTPTFVLNGQPIVGAQEFQVFQQAIEGLLGP